MSTAFILIKRNIKLFFKDKGMFFTSLITPAILLVPVSYTHLYVYKRQVLIERDGTDYPSNAFAYMNLIEHWGSVIPRIMDKVKAWSTSRLKCSLMKMVSLLFRMIIN